MDDAISFAPDVARAGISTSGPERNWPNNTWWVAAHASEVTAEPTMRWILEMPIALYRTADDEAVALHNRCPHRWAPLHLGQVDGSDLVCPYHGFQFAPSGQCVRVPTQANTPSAIRVRSFPVVERYGFVWVWTGDVQKADPKLIPEELSYLSDPGFQTVWGYKAVGGNYMQLKENVLDLTHFAFLHKNSLQISGWDRPPEVERGDGWVGYVQRHEMEPLAPVYALPAGKPVGKLANRETRGAQLSPGVNHACITIHDPEPEPGGLERFSMRVVHLTTPVSIGKSHYYWAMARDHGEPFDYAAMRAQADKVFGEDIEMVEATQQMARRSIDHSEAVEFSVTADSAAMQGRRLIEAMVKAEREGPQHED